MKRRIVTDKHGRYVVQRKSWLWPFWRSDGHNYHHDLDRARVWAQAGTVVEYSGASMSFDMMEPA